MHPLSLRADDVVILAEHYLRKVAGNHRKHVEGFTEEAREKILHHAFGDAGELERAIERAVLQSTGARIEASDLSFEGASETTFAVRIPGTTIAELERRAIIETLHACGGSTAKAAEILGISIRTIQYRMHQYGLRGRATGTSQNGGHASAL